MQLQILGSATLTDVGSNTRTTLWKTSRISIALITFVLQIFPTADTEAVPKAARSVHGDSGEGSQSTSIGGSLTFRGPRTCASEGSENHTLKAGDRIDVPFCHISQCSTSGLGERTVYRPRNTTASNGTDLRTSSILGNPLNDHNQLWWIRKTNATSPASAFFTYYGPRQDLRISNHDHVYQTDYILPPFFYTEFLLDAQKKAANGSRLHQAYGELIQEISAPGKRLIWWRLQFNEASVNGTISNTVGVDGRIKFLANQALVRFWRMEAGLAKHQSFRLHQTHQVSIDFRTSCDFEDGLYTLYYLRQKELYFLTRVDKISEALLRSIPQNPEIAYSWVAWAYSRFYEAIGRVQAQVNLQRKFPGIHIFSSNLASDRTSLMYP